MDYTLDLAQAAAAVSAVVIAVVVNHATAFIAVVSAIDCRFLNQNAIPLLLPCPYTNDWPFSDSNLLVSQSVPQFFRHCRRVPDVIKIHHIRDIGTDIP